MKFQSLAVIGALCALNGMTLAAETTPATSTAPSTQPGFTEPTEAAKALVVAMMTQDKAGVERAALPDKDLDLLLEGRKISDEMRKELEKLEFRLLKVGEKITSPDGSELEITDTMVTETSQVCITEGLPIPIVVKKENGRWRADASPLIGARKAAKKAKEAEEK